RQRQTLDIVLFAYPLTSINQVLLHGSRERNRTAKAKCTQTQEVSNEANKRDLHEFRRCCLLRNGLFNHVFLWRLSRHLICFITVIVICISLYFMHITQHCANANYRVFVTRSFDSQESLNIPL